MIELNKLFFIEYGNQADLNKLEKTSADKGIRFISRSSENLGFQCFVKRDKKFKPFKKGQITVSLGGTYVLSSFVQPDDFYTGQNVKVLTPLVEMSDIQKRFYCFAIASNRFRFTSHGREANKTLDSLLVPSLNEIPSWVYKDIGIAIPSIEPAHFKNVSLESREWRFFDLIDYFDMYAGKYYDGDSYSSGATPLVTSADSDNGVRDFTNLIPRFEAPCLTIGKISASTFVQTLPFIASSDVTVLVPKKGVYFNVFVGLFLATIINKEDYKWSYGRQIRLGDCQRLKVKLPMDKKNNPDWQHMEYYIKSLPYSVELTKEPKTKKGLSDQELITKYDTGKVVDFEKAVKKMAKSPSPTTLSKLKK